MSSKDNFSEYSSQLSDLLVDFYNIFNSWEINAVNDLDIKLTILEVHTIEALGRNPGLKMRELADILGVSTPSVTAVVDKLEKKGFAIRKTTPSDRRVYLVELTSKGNDLYKRHSEQHKKMAKTLLSSIPGDRVVLFIEMLRSIVANHSINFKK